MTFYDKKEDVLDLKLTPYGRHLISRGKFMPKYYSFLDEDVVYNVNQQGYGSITEKNSDVKNRILDETPSIKPMYTMNSVETELEDNPENTMEITDPQFVNIYDKRMRHTSDTNTKYLQNTIGTSKQATKKGPRWDIAFLSSEMNTSLTTNFTSSNPYSETLSTSASVIHIPQLEVEIEWSIQVKNTSDPDHDQNKLNNVSNVDIEVYSDGTYLDYTEEQSIIRFLEKNGFVKRDSFSIEVFEYEKDNNGDFTDRLKPLKFMNRNYQDVKDYKIDKDILIEDPYSTELPPDPSTVEYYFDLRVDKEIPLDDLCKAVDELKSEGIYIEDLEIKCPDILGYGPDGGLIDLGTGLPDGDPCDDPATICAEEE
tara:strand:- start:3078 stop:4184 length:1107 start_codon:yes stop_codon:yes gene_type:complete